MANSSILIVDDDPIVRKVIGMILHGDGHHVTEVRSAEDAQDWLHRFPVPVDLAIVDLRLPGMGGTEFAAWILEQNPAARVLIITGVGTESFPDDTLPIEGIEVLRKPFHTNDLLQRVERLLQKPLAVGDSAT
jgi:DNA-binding NtrC family response regulator